MPKPTRDSFTIEADARIDQEREISSPEILWDKFNIHNCESLEYEVEALYALLSPLKKMYCGVAWSPEERFFEMGPRSHMHKFSEMSVLCYTSRQQLQLLEQALVTKAQQLVGARCANRTGGGAPIGTRRGDSGFLHLVWD